MMKVTNTTLGMLMENGHKKNMVMVQCMKKNGEWGKARAYDRYGNETDEQVVERLAELNNCQFRLAQ